MSLKITALEAKILPVTKLIVEEADPKGADLLTTTTYSLCLDFNAIAKAEEATGRDLSTPKGWEKMSGPHITSVCWAALDRFHPQITLHQVRSWLSPNQWSELFIMLFEQCYPGVLERMEQARIERERAEALGKNEPNQVEKTV